MYILALHFHLNNTLNTFLTINFYFFDKFGLCLPIPRAYSLLIHVLVLYISYACVVRE